MRHCKLCGTPLGPDAKACPHCAHPVIKKGRPREPRSRRRLTSREVVASIILFLASLLGGWWWWQTTIAGTPQEEIRVSALSRSAWSDEEPLIEATFSPARPPTSYQLLQFVRQYATALPDTASFREQDMLSAYEGIQYATIDVFLQDVENTKALLPKKGNPRPCFESIDFEPLRWDGKAWTVRTREVYRLKSSSDALVRYDAVYKIILKVDHLQIDELKRKEVR
ncbi:zinc ribbon domain-containing protein [Exiguobacterium flavidum]|uniref:zinc ribbon domain-containing protein n=1 Tax=Exiguobacterium flavidum TaxID=2184695 RepID=UPI000DF7946E|nr:zinc ribbon domain-containing protein [Exiguobacterium flavidum]